MIRKKASDAYLQSSLDLGERGLSLVEETVDDTLAEVTVIVIIHLQDLLEGTLVDKILDIGELRRRRLGLMMRVS